MVAPRPMAVAKVPRRTSTPHPSAASSCIVRRPHPRCASSAKTYDRAGNATPVRRQSVHVCRCHTSCVTDNNRSVVGCQLSVTQRLDAWPISLSFSYDSAHGGKGPRHRRHNGTSDQSAGELLFVLQKDHTRCSLLHKGVTGRKFLSPYMAAIDHRRPIT
jgi:hypothetical protein